MSHVDAVGNFPCFMKVRVGFISNPRGGIGQFLRKKEVNQREYSQYLLL